jgi:hypothetical protein
MDESEWSEQRKQREEQQDGGCSREKGWVALLQLCRASPSHDGKRNGGTAGRATEEGGGSVHDTHWTGKRQE